MSTPSVANEAVNKAATAFYKQSGLELVYKNLEKKYVPTVVKKYGGWLIVIHEGYTHKQFMYSWEYKF